MGNLIGAAISNVYYPAADSTVAGTIERGVTVTAEGAVGAELIELWPDIERHYLQNTQKNSHARQPKKMRQAHPSLLLNPPQAP